MRFSLATAVVLAVSQSVLAFPRFDAETIKRAVENQARCPDGHQNARLVTLPPPQSFLGTMRVPDTAHPYKAPGPGDNRGPCPALNTLANHGYIPHNGVATIEEIINAVGLAFNMGHDFASFIASFATLARGNANLGMLSIGGPTDLVPPLPGCIDGTFAGGLATHGRFEGDLSTSRRDHHVGDSVDFQDDLYDQLLLYVGKYGDDGPDGKMSIINVKTYQEFKWDRYHQDQQEDKDFEFHIGRQLTTFSEVAFILDLFANGTTTTLSVEALGSIFRNQTFAPNWFRRASPAELDTLSGTAGQVMSAHPFLPGANDANGNFVVDTPPFTNFLCDAYADLVQNQLAAPLMNTTGILKKNVMTFLDAIYKPFHDIANCSTQLFPSGQAGV